MPSKPPPVGIALLKVLTYCPYAPVGEPMSKPPGTTRQRVGSLLNTAQDCGKMAMIRDWMPVAESTAAVAVPGRRAVTSCRYCGVSTKPCAELFELLRKPS